MAAPLRYTERSNSVPDLGQISRTHSDEHDFLSPNEAYRNIDMFTFLLLTGSSSDSFTDLCRKSLQKKGWKELFIEIRDNLKSDSKSLEKRFMLNRFIQLNFEDFKEKIRQINEEIDNHMSDIPIDLVNHYNPETINEIYSQVIASRKILSQQRLFYIERGNLPSLLTLQQAITDHFLRLIFLCNSNSNLQQKDYLDAFKVLFDHSLIIVGQPSGPECPAVTKYDLTDKYMTIIKTRIICLLDPNRVDRYLKLSNSGATLYALNNKGNLEGGISLNLMWKKRTITYNKNKTRTFLYMEPNDKDRIQLTEMDSKNKPLHNQRLCQLIFHNTFTVTETNIQYTSTLNSSLFGLCSHAEYFPKYLAQIIISEVEQMCNQINSENHGRTFTKYINLYHKRVCGIELNCHSRDFIENELHKISILSYEKGQNHSVNNELIQRKPFSFDIYENILGKLIVQIKFMSNHPFLSMLYNDRLFYGICSDTVDQGLKSNSRQPRLLLRYNKLEDQEIKEKPNIFVVIDDGILRKACISHKNLADEMCKCFYEATVNIETQLQVLNYDMNFPFKNFSWYSDPHLKSSNMVKTDCETIFYSLELLLKNAIQNSRCYRQVPMPNDELNSQTSTEQSCSLHTMIVSLEISGNEDLRVEAFTHLRDTLCQWCVNHGIHGSLSFLPAIDSPEWPDINDTSSILPH